MTKPLRQMVLELAPPWLTRHYGSRLLHALAVHFDALVDLTVLGFRMRFPDHATPDALTAIGIDRRIMRGFEEGASSYVTRLKRWIPDRTTKGNPYTLMRQLAGYMSGYSVTLAVVNNAGAFHFLLPDGTTEYAFLPGSWNWDNHPEKWWRFWVIVGNDRDRPWSNDGPWGETDGALWGDGGLWGTSMTRDQVDTVWALIDEWKSAHSECAGVLFLNDEYLPALPDGTWGTPIRYDEVLRRNVLTRPNRVWVLERS